MLCGWSEKKTRFEKSQKKHGKKFRLQAIMVFSRKSCKSTFQNSMKVKLNESRNEIFRVYSLKRLFIRLWMFLLDPRAFNEMNHWNTCWSLTWKKSFWNLNKNHEFLQLSILLLDLMEIQATPTTENFILIHQWNHLTTSFFK